jgi:hypothetical protein
VNAADYAPPGPLDLPPDGEFVPKAGRLDALHDALDGVTLGRHDERILAWLAGWDDPTVRTVVSLILRARAASRVGEH